MNSQQTNPLALNPVSTYPGGRDAAAYASLEEHFGTAPADFGIFPEGQALASAGVTPAALAERQAEFLPALLDQGIGEQAYEFCVQPCGGAGSVPNYIPARPAEQCGQSGMLPHHVGARPAFRFGAEAGAILPEANEGPNFSCAPVAAATTQPFFPTRPHGFY